VLGNTVAVIGGGVLFGIISAVLPLGPVTVLVVSRALSGDSSGALRVGLGRVPPEMVYCALATFGTVAALDRLPAVRAGIELVGTVLFLVIGVWMMVHRTPAAASVGPAPTVEQRRSRWGFMSGFIIAVLNPQYLFSWSAIVAIAVSMAGLKPSMLDRVVFPFAAAFGVAAGYVILVGFLRRHSSRFEGPWVQRIIRALGGLLIVLALWNVVRLISSR
jgi:threonine/homoserine/homoserine lactone efflux protein